MGYAAEGRAAMERRLGIKVDRLPCRMWEVIPVTQTNSGSGLPPTIRCAFATLPSRSRRGKGTSVFEDFPTDVHTFAGSLNSDIV